MCVVRLKGESVAQAFDQSEMQGMVAAGAQEVPREGAIHKGIGTPSRRRVQSSLWHGLPLSWQEGPPAQASLRVRAYLRSNRVGVQTDLQMVRLRSNIAHLKHHVLGDLPFHRKAPFLNGGRVQGRVELAGLEGCTIGAPGRAATGRRRRSITERNGAEQRSEQGQPGVEGRVAAERLIQVVLEGIVNPGAGAHGPGAGTGRVPGQTDARLPERRSEER